MSALIEADFLAPWLFRLAAAGTRLRLRRLRDEAALLPGCLRLQRASLVGPAVTVVTHGMTSDVVTESDVLLGASSLAWWGPREVESWRMRSGPLPKLCLGRPDARRGWALIDASMFPYMAGIDAFARENDMQLHVIGNAGPRIDGTVRWVTGSQGLASLLGKMSIVFAAPGPLAWDAARAGILVADASPANAAREHCARRRLAHVVPYPLVDDLSFWSELLSQVRSGEPLAGWGTVAWTARAQREPRSAGLSYATLASLERKLMKLRRDPHAFFAHSRVSWLRTLATAVSGPLDGGRVDTIDAAGDVYSPPGGPEESGD